MIQEPATVIAPAPSAVRDRCSLGDSCPTKLKCQLARECLPQVTPDPHAKFAWANAICALFALVGVIGLMQPLFVLPAKAVQKPVLQATLFNPPPPAPVSQPTAANNVTAPADSQPVPVETPAIVPAVAPMSSEVTFAVPVDGPVRLVAAQYAPPPPANLKPVSAPASNYGQPGGNGSSGPGPQAFTPSAGDGGYYPRPEKYPTLAQQRGWQGTVMLDVSVNVRGKPYLVSVAESSRYRILDNEALEWVKNNWQFPVGPERRYLVPFVYKLK